MKAGARIVIIGNGPVSDSAGAAIASADCVIRFNMCLSYRLGQRTDIVAICNTGRPARDMIGSAQETSAGREEARTLPWTLHPAVRDAGAIWCVRDPAFFAALRGPLAITHPELDDFCDDGTDLFRDYAARAGKAFRVLDRQPHDHADAALAALSPAPYVVPSSGLVVIADVLTREPSAEVTMTGFSHVGWDGHPFATEAQLVDRWVAEGRLRRLPDRADAMLPLAARA